jgi:hypothetical protein
MIRNKAGCWSLRVRSDPSGRSSNAEASNRTPSKRSTCQTLVGEREKCRRSTNFAADFAVVAGAADRHPRIDIPISRTTPAAAIFGFQFPRFSEATRNIPVTFGTNNRGRKAAAVLCAGPKTERPADPFGMGGSGRKIAVRSRIHAGRHSNESFIRLDAAKEIAAPKSPTHAQSPMMTRCIDPTIADPMPTTQNPGNQGSRGSSG